MQSMPIKLFRAKPFKSYSDLIDLLIARGMNIPDTNRAERKISQIGYYRLSGFWYVFRSIAKDAQGNVIPSPLNSRVKRHPTKGSGAAKINPIPLRADNFIPGTHFDDIIALYIFDKKLRLALMDALERIEIYIRSLIAHEMGQADPMAYENSRYIDPQFIKNGDWKKWQESNEAHIDRSHEDCIVWHHLTNKQIPFWVVVETWDFGLLSKYFACLNYGYQKKVTDRIDPDLSPKVLKNWLHELNVLRNRCAHHIRVWNQTTDDKTLSVSGIPCFKQLQLSENARKRLCGFIAVAWFFLHKINPTSQWLKRIRPLIQEQVKNHAFQAKAMGFSDISLPELEDIERLL